MNTRNKLFHVIWLTIAIMFLPLMASAQTGVKGDANGDGLVNAADIAEVTNYIMGNPTAHFNAVNADANGDGMVNAEDIKVITTIISQTRIKDKNVDMTFYFLSNNEYTESTLPHFIVDYGKYTLIDISSSKDCMAFQLFDYDNYKAYIFAGVKETLMIYEYDPDTNICGNNVLMARKENNEIIIKSMNVNWDTMDFTIESTTAYSETHARSLKRANRFGVDEDFEFGLQWYSDLTGEVSKWTSFLPGVGKAFSRMTGVLSSWYDTADSEEDLKTPWIELIKSQATDYLVRQIPIEFVNDYIDEIIYNNWGWEIKDLLAAKRMNKDEIRNEISWAQINERTSNARYRSQQLESVRDKVFTNEYQYEVNVNVANITNTSAVISGSYKEILGGASIFKMGYKVTGPDYNQDIESFNLVPVTVNDLTPRTTYTVYAYLTSISGQFFSDTYTFTTQEDDIIVSPMSLEFGAEGGSETITVTATDGIIWSVTSYPEWTKVSISDNVLTVTVGEADEEERSGSIVIEAHMLSGEVKNVTINVAQEAKKIEPDIPVSSDFHFTGTIQVRTKGKSWIRDEVYDYNDNNSYEITAELYKKDGEYYLTLTLYGETSSPYLIGSKPEYPQERDEGGWLYEVQDFQYSIDNDIITQSYKVVGDLSYNNTYDRSSQYESETVTDKSTGFSTETFQLVITGLSSSTPICEIKTEITEKESGETTWVKKKGNKTTTDHYTSGEESFTESTISMTGSKVAH